MESLNGRVALVTGGGAGLGAAVCECLGEAGVTVVVADVRNDLAQNVAKRIEQAGGQAVPLELDVSNEEQDRQAVARIADQFGRLDILVNNAGVDVTVSIEELAVADWDRIVRTNLTGPFMLSKFALPVMRGQGGGQIVNVVSTAAKRAWANAAAYHASKWGLLGFTYALHVEGRKDKVKVTAVIAGGMRTGFLLDRFPDIDQDTLQEPRNVAEVIRSVLVQPAETVVPEVMVLPMRETSWP